MRYEPKTLDVKAAIADGDAFPVLHLAPLKTVQVHGTFSATVQVQGRVQADEAHADWVSIGAALTAPGLVNLADANGNPFVITHVRIKTTAYASGAPKAAINALAVRTD